MDYFEVTWRREETSSNLDPTRTFPSMYEPSHGSAPDIAGQGIANPTAILMSAILMLRHIEEFSAAERVEKAMLDVYAEGKTLTRDLGGTAKTNEFARAIVERMGHAAAA